MADSPEQKVPKITSDNDSVDRLSALPDCVLLHILSSFDTKDAAVTSILSTRWRNLFISLPDVDLSFCVDNVDGSDRDRLFSDFINLANRVIRRRNQVPIRKIQLCVKHFVGSYRFAIESLVSAAAISLSNVQELGISVLPDDTEQVPISVSLGIFTCKTLVSLSLDGQVDWIVPNLVFLPNLKWLSLKKFRLVDEYSIRRFLQGCPSLRRLILFLQPFNQENENEGIEVKVLDISSPSLEIWLSWCEEVKFEFTVVVKSNNLKFLLCYLKGQHKVIIDAPNLTSLIIGGHVLEVNIVQNLMSLDNAAVRANFLCHGTTESSRPLHVQRAFKFFSGLENVKSLHLSLHIFLVLYLSLHVSQKMLPIFRNLIELKLISFVWHALTCKALSSLLVCSPNLKVLIFTEVFWNYFTEDKDDPDFPEVSPLTSIEHIREVKIGKFKGEEHEFKLVEYFVKNGKSLKKMTLVRESWNSLSEGCNRILSFKKCSEDCQIVFEKESDWIKCRELRKELKLSA